MMSMSNISRQMSSFPQMLMPCQPKFREGVRWYGRRERVRILDVGCGNHSPGLTRGVWPGCEYHGVDVGWDNVDEGDKGEGDRVGGYGEIPEGMYDLLIMSHVLEHIRGDGDGDGGPLGALRRVCGKLRVGGVLWLSFPSERSLRLPSALGTLQFCDDPGHVYFPVVGDVVNVLLGEGLVVERAGVTRDWVRWVVGLMVWVRERVVRKGLLGLEMRARGLWFVYGFEYSIVARKPGEMERRSDGIVEVEEPRVRKGGWWKRVVEWVLE